MLRLNGSETAERLPVWRAMTELFLDTEVRWEIPWVAYCCAGSRFPAEALDSIFRDEVAPAMLPNLLEVAGSWAMFRDEYIQSEILTCSRPRPDLAGTPLDTQWATCLDLCALLRQLPEDRRKARFQVWRHYIRLFLAEPTAGDEESAIRNLSGFSESDRLGVWQTDLSATLPRLLRANEKGGIDSIRKVLQRLGEPIPPLC